MKSKLRIAYFAEIFPSKSETWVHNEILELQKLGYEVKVFSTWKAPEKFAKELEEFYSITVYRKHDNWISVLKRIPSILKLFFDKKVLNAFLFDCNGFMQRAQVIRDCFIILSLLDEINKFRPNISYAHFAATRANLSFLYKSITGIPYIIKIHAGDVFGRTAMFASKVNESLCVFSISQYNIDFILKREKNITKDKLSINHCGIDLLNYSFKPHAIQKENVEIVSVGRLVRMKGFDILIDACNNLIKRGVNLNVTIIGNGPLKQDLHHQINMFNLQNHIVLKDYCPPSEIKEHLSTASIFILPCRYDEIMKTQDGIPVALMEAMAIGTPVISTSISGIPELISNGENGFIVQPENPELLSKKVQNILQMNPVEIERIVLNARKTIEDTFNISFLTKELINDVTSHIGRFE